jgi:enoyl-CoA hydratase/carnithine racemase
MDKAILVDRADSVIRIGVNRPDRGNAFTDEMISELTAAISAVRENDRVVLISSAGRDFCVGREASTAPLDPLRRRAWADNVFGCYGAIRNCAIPVVAAVRGRAFGFGCAIAAISDITLASGDARFQVPEITHSVMPGNVLSAFIDRVSRKGMIYLALSAAEIDALLAQTYGIVTTVVPEQALDALVEQTVRGLATMPTAAAKAVKEYVRVASDMPIEGAVEYGRSLHAVINSSGELRNAR